MHKHLCGLQICRQSQSLYLNGFGDIG